MKLEEIKGVKHYLENDCYCQFEIYSMDGFFYQLFKPEEECKYLGQHKDAHYVISKDQLIQFWKKTNEPETIIDSTRYDATENNIKMCKMLIDGKTTTEISAMGLKIDTFPNNDVKRDLEKIMSIADAIMISN